MLLQLHSLNHTHTQCTNGRQCGSTPYRDGSSGLVCAYCVLALTDQDIQCHPQDLKQHTVKYKTMNGTDVNNTHNIKRNLTANIAVKCLLCIYCSEHHQNEDLCVGGGGGGGGG